jgi:hypothetical protein
MDAALEALTRAVDEGHDFPELTAVVGAFTVSGKPVPGQAAVEAIMRAVGQTRWDAMDAKEKKTRRGDQGMDDGWDEVASTLSPVRTAMEGAVLSLAPALVMSGDHGIKLPAIRVPVEAVAMWWIPSTGREVKPSGGGMFLGVALPLNLGS